MDGKAHHKAKKSKKEKKRSVSTAETSNDANEQELESLSLENQLLIHEKKKKKKSENVKDKCNSIASSQQATTAYAEASSEANTIKEKKKKKIKKEPFLEGGEGSKVFPLHESDGLSTPSKKKKRNRENCSVVTEEPCNDVPSVYDGSVTTEKGSKNKNKHKKKRRHCESDDEPEIKSDENDSLSPCKKGKKETLPDDNIQTENTKKKKKKKEKHKLGNEISCGENISLIDKQSKKEKKKKKDDSIDDVKTLTVSCEENMVPLCEKKSKKKKKKEEQADGFETKSKTFSDERNKQKSESESATGDAKIVSNGSGKMKKKAKRTTDLGDEEALFQNEKHLAVKKIKSESIESTSEPSKPLQGAMAETDSVIDVEMPATGQPQKIIGQWHGDLFGSADRQNKFLRLLGGMKSSDKDSGKSTKLFNSHGTPPKKGLFGSLVSKVGGGNALSVSDAANLNHNLEEDYNRALDLKLTKKRGTGLGFVPDPAEGKKFHIDVKTKSVKFDD